MTADPKESAFQNDIIKQMVANGWKLGDPTTYDRDRALYPADCLQYVKTTQPETWQKYTGLYPNDPEKAFLDKLADQLAKADPNASDKNLRSFGTLGVLRNELRDKSASFKLCQFKPDHALNPDTQKMYEANILRVVPELVYSPYATEEHLAETGIQAKKWRIDLVLFLNGIPIITMELKSEFKQSVDRAIKQYRKTRLPKDPATNKPEPLLTFKRGALVHFAVSQYEVFMTTRLAGDDTRFRPFNKGTKDGAKGNDVPDDPNRYATDYLWNDVLDPENLLQIVGRFIHLEIKKEEDWNGRKSKKENLIFPRYHQWDLVTRLVRTSREEGPGHKYLAQHSAGSGKSNSIAWSAHQLANLHDNQDQKVFHSVIVVTDRTVLDDQLQDTISQFEHKDGVVGRINRNEGEGSKSEKLATALSESQPIIIVTIQTFPHVLEAIADDANLKERRFAIIADEAHSSQSGQTASKLKKILSTDATEDRENLTAEEMLEAEVKARGESPNISYYAFTATPKSKTLELFGRRPKPSEPASDENKPEAFHVYSMRQAIEEGFILDVLRNYTNYKVAYNLSQKLDSDDTQVDSKRAKVKLDQWVKLHDYNIAQKVKVIVEHFRDNIMSLLDGQAKAMVVTGSRKEAVRYKLEFDKYVQREGFTDMKAMVAFSGEVEFSDKDPNAEGLLNEKFSEHSMNTDLRGQDMREAFDTEDFQVMIVAQKFQTGFDQPKLCAMYVDKKIGGLDCVQTLSRLNRTYPGKEETFVLDFYNEPEDVLSAFQVYYKTASLLNVSDPNLLWDLFEKLRASSIIVWTEVRQYTEAYFVESKSSAAISNIIKPAKERWQHRLGVAKEEVGKFKERLDHAKSIADATSIANAEDDLKEAKAAVDELGIFKSDLLTFTRQYEFLSQIADFDSTDLEMLSIYARDLAPLLRDADPDDDPVDLSSVELSRYRLSKIAKRRLKLDPNEAGGGLDPATGPGTGKARSKEEEFLSVIITRLNELFVTDGLTDLDQINYAKTLCDKISENERVMNQIKNNSPEQALLGDFPGALDQAVIESGEAHENQMLQYLNSKEVQAGFGKIIFDMLQQKIAS